MAHRCVCWCGVGGQKALAIRTHGPDGPVLMDAGAILSQDYALKLKKSGAQVFSERQSLTEL